MARNRLYIIYVYTQQTRTHFVYSMFHNSDDLFIYLYLYFYMLLLHWYEACCAKCHLTYVLVTIYVLTQILSLCLVPTYVS